MRVKSVTERYRAVNEGTMSKKEFVRQMRQQYPMHITQFNGFDDSVQILKNRGLLFETKTEVVEEAKVYDDRPALTYSLDALDRGIRVELATMGVEPGQQSVKAEDLKKATKKAKDNLEKNATHYLDLMSGESKKVDKQDKMKETKRGAKDTDVMNGLKKATLKEGYTEEQIEAAIQRIKERKTSIGEVEKSEEEKEIQGFKDKALVDAGVSLTGTGASTHEIVFDHRGTTQTIAFRDSEEAAEQAKAKLEDTGYFGDKNLRVVPAGMKEDSVEEEDGYNTDPNLQMHIDDEEWERENGRGPKEDIVKEAGKTALIQTMNNAISAIKDKYGDQPGIAGIIREFLKTHIDDLADGADPLDEFESFIEIRYNNFVDENEDTVSELDGTGAVDAATAIISALGLTGGAVALSSLMDALEAGKLGEKGKSVAKFLRSAGKTFSGQGAPMKEGEIEEKKGKDHDGDGDIDGDDYMAAKDKAIKGAMGKKVDEIGMFHDPIGYDSTAPAEDKRALEFIKSLIEKGVDRDSAIEKAGDKFKLRTSYLQKKMSADSQIKEAVKTLIRKALTEEALNEAATGNLSKF